MTSDAQSLGARIVRMPRAFDPEMGREARAGAPFAGGDVGDLIAGAGGSSPYLKGLIAREADWLETALPDPEGAVDALLAALRETAPDLVLPALRQAKRRLALIVALADLCGAWDLAEVTGTLSGFAALACDLAARAEIARLIRRGRLSGQTEDDLPACGGLSILAMGKMGAGELNYSSDIDLICLFDETRFDPSDYGEARAGFVRATRAFSAALSERTADGYVFRTDLRLRPDPAVTPVVMPMEAAERYYESLGRTWERAAYIKARAAAGDTEAGRRFLATLRPFVWRRHLDFAAIQDAHDIRLRIRETRAKGGAINVPGHDLKLGRGGIREIEFFTQTRQLIAGGRDPSLRQRGTLAGLAALTRKGWVEEAACARLSSHYTALREAEHRVQMVNDAQTHKIPSATDGLGRVAALSGISPETLVSDLKARLEEVHHLTEAFFAPGASGSASGGANGGASGSASGQGSAKAPEPEAPEDLDPAILARWTSYPALRSDRAARIFQRLRPELLRRLAQASKPEEALIALDGFLAGLPAGVQLFSLFEANPHLLDLLIDIVGTSPALAAHLSRNSAVFDAVIGGDFFDDWPGEAGLTQGLAAAMEAEDSYEAHLDTARGWQREWHFRIGVHLLRGLITPDEASGQYADLAGAVLTAMLPVVEAEFARRHGPAPGRGAAVLGMGSLGARQLTAQSDLDIIVIYDPEQAETSDGPRPLPVRPYYARLTQALITALTAPMARGRLYEVDMRLRPSGNQGPVATSWNSFRSYQSDEAWTWEHLALTRARPVAGNADLCRDIEVFRTSLLGAQVDRAQVLDALRDMRARIAAAKGAVSVWDIKTGPGRMQDVELVAQAGTLLAGSAARDVPSGLQSGVSAGWLTSEDAAALVQAHRLYRAINVSIRLISPDTPQTLGEGAAAFLCRVSGQTDITGLQGVLETAYAQTANRIAALIGEQENGNTRD